MIAVTGASAVPVAQPAPKVGLGKPRILIVDDEPSLLRVLAKTLENGLDGAVVETCDAPLRALRNIAAGDYDVIVSELSMAEMHGLELLERVRAIHPSTPVVLITDAEDRDLTVRALRGGAYEFIQKPIEAEYFVAAVARAVETRRLRFEVEWQEAALRRHADALERMVEERTLELRRANQTKDEFLATLSHALRTPLTAILGWARLLSSGKLDDATRSQAIESTARSARSLAQLIDDALDLSRIITGKLCLDVEPVDLFAVLDAALGVVLPAAKAKAIELEPRLDRSIVPILGDPKRLQQVLWNLLSNAIKFTPSGGKIVVRMTRRERSVEIEVSDNGAGIEPEFLPFVFERFRQSDSQVSSRRALGLGLGIGLSIARHLVELHGGTVAASSAGKGKGATFTVVLPYSEREPNQTRRTPS